MDEPNVEPIEPTDVDPNIGGLEPPADPPAEPDPTAPPADPPAEPRGKDAEITQERFDEIYGRMSRAERALSAQQRKPEPQDKPKELTDRPREEDFPNYTDFVDKLTDWKADQREVNRTAETNKRNQERNAKAAQATFDDNLTKAERADPDFRDKAYLHPDIAKLVYDSDNFADLGYFFKDNPKENNRLLLMVEKDSEGRLTYDSSVRIANEIGRIEASFGKPKPKTKTNAPAATRPVGTSAAPDKKAEDMEEGEYMAHRKAQLYPGSP